MCRLIVAGLCLLAWSACVAEEDAAVEPQPDVVSPKHTPPDDVCQLVEQLPRVVWPDPADPCDVQVLYIDRDYPGGGLGTQHSPASSLEHARQLTLDNPRIHYWFIRGRGPYKETLKAIDGVHVVGGFYGPWRHDKNLRTVIEGAPSSPGYATFGAVFQNIQSPVTWMNLDIQSKDAQYGATSYGLWAWRSPAMTLRNVRILAGRGGEGFNGDVGKDGADGSPGQMGLPGVSWIPEGKSAWGQGSIGATRQCFTEGKMTRAGRGGNGAGEQGVAQFGRDAQSQPTTPPSTDGDHAPAFDLRYASDGAPGRLHPEVSIGGFWRQGELAYGGNGVDGQHGLHGHGGGGGMLGSGFMHIAPGGASGGTGGCGGTGGQGGSPGGSSFGLFLSQSPGWQLLDGTEVVANVAGPGGHGAPGGMAGQGGKGGPRQTQWCHPVGHRPACDEAPFFGGAGGDGADGQHGGHGGGGAAGWSISVYCDQSEKPEGAYKAYAPAKVQGGFSGEGRPRGQNGLSLSHYSCQ